MKAKAYSLSCVIELLLYSLVGFSFKNLTLGEATVDAIVVIIFKAAQMFRDTPCNFC